MRLIRPAAIIAALLIIAISFPPSLFSQTAPKSPQPKQPAPPKRQPKRPQRADALAPAINDLLELDPLPPQSPDDKDSDNDDASSGEQRKPPADDAPIKELIDYWRQDHGAKDPKPSDRVRQLLLEACEDRPELTFDLVNFLPETTDTHDRLYKLFKEDWGDEFNWKRHLQRWLQGNSRYFRDDLIAAARGEDVGESSPENSLRSLARIDWEAARPMVEIFASAGNARMASMALSLLYERSQAVGDSGQVEKFRALLKAIVVNRQTPYEARQAALSSLTKTEWEGQENWVVSLFTETSLNKPGEDEGEGASGSRDESTVLAPLMDNPERWLPVIGALVGHHQRMAHQLAVECLTNHLYRESADKKLKKEIAQKLAPCLTHPDWSAASGRSAFIHLLAGIQAPELLSGLIWVMEHDEDEDNRAAAAAALTQYRDPRANPALRRALEKEENEDHREKIVTALAECGGLSDDEMAAAVEAYAKIVVTEAGEGEIDEAKNGDSEKPLSLQVSVGRILSESETTHATEGLAARLIERAKSLRASQPAVARQILRGVEGAPLRIAEINLVERIGAGWADTDALKLALENRGSLQKSATDELYNLIKQGGYATGVAAAILSDEREQIETLRGTDAKAQLALLACARYLRDKLPVELAGRLLVSPNRALAKAVESYLEVEDSAEARRLVLARRRGEASILGDLAAIYGLYPERVRKWEERLRKEIKGGAGLDAIYALLRLGYNGVVIRIRDRKAEISIYDVEGRREVRLLTESEFEELKSFTSRQEVEDLGPETYDYNPERLRYAYLRLTKDGGRRIALDHMRRAPKNPTLHEELSGLFFRLSNSGEFVTRYEIEDKIPGVEVLLADKKQYATMVCGEGREIRVLVGEKWGEYRRGIARAMPEWHEVSSGKLGNVTDEPAACPQLGMIHPFIKIRSNLLYNEKSNFWEIHELTRSGAAWIFVPTGIDAGVWKVELGGEPEKIISGSYDRPVVTPDSKWMVAIKKVSQGGEYSLRLVRHNLQTGEEFQVKMANYSNGMPVKYIAAHGKVLLDPGFHVKSSLGPINYLLDPETGTVQQVTGEFRPLTYRFVRELQPTGNPNEFWAAIHDSQKEATGIGRYDTRKFVFTPIIEAPGPVLRDSNFWVDEGAGKIWFTYYGHLLRLPMPAQKK